MLILVGLFSMSILQPIIWSNPSNIEWALMLAMGLVATGGHFLII